MFSYKLHYFQGLHSRPQIDFLCCIEANFEMEATCDIMLQTHSVNVCSKRCALHCPVKSETN